MEVVITVVDKWEYLGVRGDAETKEFNNMFAGIMQGRRVLFPPALTCSLLLLLYESRF